MSVQHFYNAYFLLNSVDLSNHVESVRLESKADMLEKTAMSNNTHIFTPGLYDWSLEVVMYQDYASGSVDATLNTIIAGGAAVTFEVRPDAGSVATTNPKWTGSVCLESFPPIGGGVGTLQKLTAKFRPASALTRATS